MARHDEGNLRIRNLYISQTAGAFQAENLTAPNLDNRQFVLDLATHALELGGAGAAELFTSLPTNTLGGTAASFDWRPATGSPIATGGLTDFAVLPDALQSATQSNGHPNSVITPTAYRGAAAPGGPAWWAAGRTTPATGSKGLNRALARYGGRPLRAVGHTCPDSPQQEGENLIRHGCSIRRVDEKGDTVGTSLFGAILERDGRFKFISYANRL
jgi:hypothetical protein